MRVKVGNKVYDAKDEPIMVILELQDKENIANMPKAYKKYCSFPDDKDHEQIKKWMDEGV